MKFFKEFKEFINRGNVVDMAVGVVIATAFGKITSSLVSDIIMPLMSMLTGGISFEDKKWVLSPAVPATDTTPEIAEVAVKYGLFLQYVVDFLIVALAVFIFIKVFTAAGNKAMALRKKKEEEEKKKSRHPNRQTKKCCLPKYEIFLKSRIKSNFLKLTRNKCCPVGAKLKKARCKNGSRKFGAFGGIFFFCGKINQLYVE